MFHCHFSLHKLEVVHHLHSGSVLAPGDFLFGGCIDIRHQPLGAKWTIQNCTVEQLNKKYKWFSALLPIGKAHNLISNSFPPPKKKNYGKFTKPSFQLPIYPLKSTTLPFIFHAFLRIFWWIDTPPHFEPPLSSFKNGCNQGAIDTGYLEGKGGTTHGRNGTTRCSALTLEADLSALKHLLLMVQKPCSW